MIVAQFHRTPYEPPLSVTLPSQHAYRNMATKSLSAPSPASIPPLLRLPAELHLNIVSELQESGEYGAFATLNLRLLNRYFYSLIDKPSHETLLSIEKTPWVIGRLVYTCRYCIRLRCITKFADAMLKGKTGPNGGQPEKRFCADCGFAAVTSETRYSAGTMATVDGERWIWCVHCRQVKRGDQAGKKEWCGRSCKGCFEPVGCKYFHPCKSAAKEDPGDYWNHYGDDDDWRAFD
jgi:hypothetical protein